MTGHMLIKVDTVKVVVLRHPARICHDAAHAVAAERGLSHAEGVSLAKRTWADYGPFSPRAEAWPALVAHVLDTHRSELQSGRK